MLLQNLLHGRVHLVWSRNGRNEARGNARVATVDQHLHTLLVSLFNEITQLRVKDMQSIDSTHLRDLKSTLTSQDGAKTCFHCWRYATLLEKVLHARTKSTDIDTKQLKTRQHPF